MAKAAILYNNVADLGIVTTSSWVALAPPSMLQNAHTARRWVGASGATEYIILNLNTADFPFKTIDTVGLFKCAGLVDDSLVDLDVSAVTRVRVSSSDPTGVAGDLYDSGSQTGQITYGALVKLLPVAVNAATVRIDLSQGNCSALEAGRLVVGQRYGFGVNFAYGWSFGFNDLSRLKKSAAGQTFVDLDDRYRVLSVSFDFLSVTERYNIIQEIDRLNGISSDVLFISDTASDNLGRDSVWGLMQDTSPPTQPQFDLYVKTFSIQERL